MTCKAALVSPDLGAYKRQLADYFAKRAPTYEVANLHHPVLASQLVKRAQLQPGWRVLDIATGTGLVAVQALKAVGENGHVVGLDYSPAMLQQVSSCLPYGVLLGRLHQCFIFALAGSCEGP